MNQKKKQFETNVWMKQKPITRITWCEKMKCFLTRELYKKKLKPKPKTNNEIKYKK